MLQDPGWAVVCDTCYTEQGVPSAVVTVDRLGFNIGVPSWRGGSLWAVKFRGYIDSLFQSDYLDQQARLEVMKGGITPTLRDAA